MKTAVSVAFPLALLFASPALAATPAAVPQLVAAAATRALGFAVCVPGDMLAASCQSKQAYAPRKRARYGFMSSKDFFAAPRLVREFDAAFTTRRKRMERCLAQKPAREAYRRAVVWQWSQQRPTDRIPDPSRPDYGLHLSSQQISLANYQYCMTTGGPP
jgi:hypothetical protein